MKSELSQEQITFYSENGYPVFAVNENYGQIVVCELNITQSISTDPRAVITLKNLITAQIKKDYTFSFFVQLFA